jgi:hypothetical protein
MSTAAHTPGKWEVFVDSDQPGVTYVLPDRSDDLDPSEPSTLNDGYDLAHCYGPDQAANARLLASAPNLLAECEREYASLADIQNEWPGRASMKGQQKLCRLRDLIAAATGRTQQDVQDDYTARATIARATGEQP